jgi:hypothetical protein
MSFLIGFEAVNTELSGTTWQVPGFYLTAFHPLSVSGKIDWHASDSARVLSQLSLACCVLGVRC